MTYLIILNIYSYQLLLVNKLFFLRLKMELLRIRLNVNILYLLVVDMTQLLFVFHQHLIHKLALLFHQMVNKTLVLFLHIFYQIKTFLSFPYQLFLVPIFVLLLFLLFQLFLPLLFLLT